LGPFFFHRRFFRNGLWVNGWRSRDGPIGLVYDGFGNDLGYRQYLFMSAFGL